MIDPEQGLQMAVWAPDSNQFIPVSRGAEQIQFC